jgi:hypothetical protein
VQSGYSARFEQLELGEDVRYRNAHLIAHVPEDSHEGFLCRKYFLGKMQRIE